MRLRVGRPLAVLLLALTLVLAGLGARALAMRTWNAVVDYRTPFAVPLPPAPGGPGPARRALLIVADGLRVDTFTGMAVRERFRARAALGRAWATPPTLSYPGWTAIVTGAPPEISGVTTNWHRGPVRVDSLFAAARRAGHRTAVAGHPGWRQLFGADLDDFVAVPDPPLADLAAIHQTTIAVARAGERFLREGAAALVLLHFPAPDLMAHGYGVRSQPYADTVRVLDEELGRLLAQVDLTTTAVLLTADHGHLDRGGHGGGEEVVRAVPLLLAGPGVAAGERFEARHVDLAPTLAALLGLPIPSHSVGRPLIEAFAAMPEGLDRRWGQQQAAIFGIYAQVALRRHAPVFTTPLGTATPEEALMAAADDLARQMAEWRERGLGGERRSRLPGALVLALLPLAGLLAYRPRRDLLPAAAGAAVFFIVALGLYVGRGYTFSLSVINREELLRPFFDARAREAALALGAAAFAAGWGARRRGAATGAVAGLTAAYLVAWVVLLHALHFWVLWGFRFPWYLPDLGHGFRFYLSLVAMVPVGVLAPVTPAVGLVGYAAGRGLEWLRRGGAPRRRAPRPDTPSPGASPGPPA